MATRPNLSVRGTLLAVDLPDMLAEVTAAFERYEAALVSNDVSALDSLFCAHVSMLAVQS